MDKIDIVIVSGLMYAALLGLFTYYTVYWELVYWQKDFTTSLQEAQASWIGFFVLILLAIPLGTRLWQLFKESGVRLREKTELMTPAHRQAREPPNDIILIRPEIRPEGQLWVVYLNGIDVSSHKFFNDAEYEAARVSIYATSRRWIKGQLNIEFARIALALCRAYGIDVEEARELIRIALAS